MSFVKELTRISEQADKKLKLRHGSATEAPGEQRQTSQQLQTAREEMRLDGKANGQAAGALEQVNSPTLQGTGGEERPITAP